MFSAVFTLLAAATACVRADPSPTSPGPGDVFIEDQLCTISWDADPTGAWKDMKINLMTGENLNMVFLASIATHLDGTSPRKNTFSYTCPQVTPHAPIYFYQFSSSSTSNKTWTGRFTITNSTNSVVDPPESTQPDGEEIPWGRGSLVRASSASAGSGSAARSGTRTASAPSIQRGSPLVSPGYAGFGSVAQSGTLMSSTPSIASGSPLLSALQSNTPALSADTPGASGTVSAAEANGAVATLFASNVLVKSGLALVLAALGFTAVF